RPDKASAFLLGVLWLVSLFSGLASTVEHHALGFLVVVVLVTLAAVGLGAVKSHHPGKQFPNRADPEINFGLTLLLRVPHNRMVAPRHRPCPFLSANYYGISSNSRASSAACFRAAM